MKSLIGAGLSAYVSMPRHKGKARVLRAISSVMPQIPVRSRYGVRMLTAPDATTAMSIVGAYDDVFEALAPLKKGMAFIDIGANAGVFSLVAATRLGIEGRVISFEPSSKIFRLFVNNIALNHAENVIPFQAALGEQSGFMNFDPASRSHSGGAHLAIEGSERVLVLGGGELESLLKLCIGDREIMVKIDVEGAELLVLNALRPILAMPSVRRVIAEVSIGALARFRAEPRTIYQVMAEYGLRPTTGLQTQPVYNEVFHRC